MIDQITPDANSDVAQGKRTRDLTILLPRKLSFNNKANASDAGMQSETVTNTNKIDTVIDCVMAGS